jgi:glyoxylase-like metal-dependent hydrolase (beta-lactamase superfamily II)
VEELFEGVRRVTFSLPLGIDHVHCYLLRSSSGGWILVDTGLGVRDPEAVWAPLVAELDAPIERVVVTHMHPDHVGGARDVAGVTGASVLQGREDYEQCVRAWGPTRSGLALAEYMVAHGMPVDDVEVFVADSSRLAARVHWFEEPQLLEPGDEVDGWRVELLRGHADGHVVLLRDGVMIAGDAILGRITPAIGLYLHARPDPLGDYFESLRRIEELAPRVALAGHGPTIDDPPARAREIAAHHYDRLGRTQAALGPEPRTAYEVSLALFPGDLPPAQRRFALAESLAHLERLVLEGRAERVNGAYVVSSRA